MNGYEMLGWYTEASGGEQITEDSVVSIDADHILYAHWQAKSCQLSFDTKMDGVENPQPITVTYDEVIGSLPSVFCEGYTFDGWFDARNRKVTGDTVCTFTSDTTVYAHWTQYEVHEHVYTSEITKEPTCTEAGEKTYSCSCGDTYTEDIPARGHQEEKVAGKEDSCTETGLTEGTKCSVCGTVLKKQEVVPMSSHTEETVAGREASCTDTGLTDGTKCSVCGKILKEQLIIPALGHTEEVLEKKEATCTETGLTEGKKCSVCGEILKAQTVIPAKGHIGEDVEGKEPTCTDTGLTEGKKCSVCGEILVPQRTISALGHQEEIIKGISATCTEEGLSDGKKCSVCGNILTPQTIVPAKGHSWNSDFTVEKAATYTEKGKKSIHCKVCDAVKEGSEQEIPMLIKSEDPPATPTPAPSQGKEPVTTPAPAPREDSVLASDGTHAGAGASAEKAAAAITVSSSDEGPKGTSYGLLQAKQKKVTRNSIKIGWARISGVKYVVYGNACGKGKRFKKLKETSSTSFTQKKLKTGKYYKYLVMAVKDGKVVATSKTLHITTSGGTAGNPKKATISRQSLTLKKGRKKKLTAKVVEGSPKARIHRKVSWESSDPTVASVVNGKVTALKKGTTVIYAYTQNGMSAKCRVRVK